MYPACGVCFEKVSLMNMQNIIHDVGAFYREGLICIIHILWSLTEIGFVPVQTNT